MEQKSKLLARQVEELQTSVHQLENVSEEVLFKNPTVKAKINELSEEVTMLK